MAKQYVLKLYVTDNTANSQRTLKALKHVLDDELKGIYQLKVIDVLKNPQLAEEDKILATPTLVKVLPSPVRKIIGDLSDREKVLLGLDFTILMLSMIPLSWHSFEQLSGAGTRSSAALELVFACGWHPEHSTPSSICTLCGKISLSPE